MGLPQVGPGLLMQGSGWDRSPAFGLHPAGGSHNRSHGAVMPGSPAKLASGLRHLFTKRSPGDVQLGQVLIERGIITQEDLAAALAEQRKRLIETGQAIRLGLAFFAYNRGLPLTIRSVFYPLLGDRIYGFWGNLIDVLSVLATLVGLATSLGLGVKQINAGLAHLFGFEIDVPTQVTLIAVITGFATMETAKESFKKGVFDFLAKPFKLGEIKEVVAKAESKIKGSR